MTDQQRTPCAADFMNRHVEVVTQEMTLTEVIRFLLKHKVSNAPVVEHQDEKHMLVGFVSERDCLSALSNELFFGNPSPAQTVRTIMSAHPICISPETELFSIVSIFVSHHLRHLPVVENGILMGIVSRHEILAAMETYYDHSLHNQEHERLLRDTSQSLNLRFLIDRS
ncbi:CBS domain-containing protein [Gimesia algae]|uniref:Putative voltage-gated ClC-type chloride channel ClcB n=1 Tax=Gimesia algae TaxID=2527971 RepID=A0A517VAE1_9PLAN|nr:CBS domain-containing protein [Gimesia algae]QDT89972.1 putative voltage-gated ClC-type chloride channel ClcB [Gimesia algae]